MKEAAGEANMTVITIVLIAVVLGVASVVVTNLMNTTGKKSACADIGGTIINANTCQFRNANGNLVNHTCTKTNGNWNC